MNGPMKRAPPVTRVVIEATLHHRPRTSSALRRSGWLGLSSSTSTWANIAHPAINHPLAPPHQPPARGKPDPRQPEERQDARRAGEHAAQPPGPGAHEPVGAERG